MFEEYMTSENDMNFDIQKTTPCMHTCEYNKMDGLRMFVSHKYTNA